MEKSKATSDYVYEDEFSYVTAEGDIFRKGNTYQDEKKLADTDADDFESELAALRSNFVDLQKELSSSEQLSEDEAEQWKERLNNAEAIGNFDALYQTLEQLQQANESSEKEEPEISEEADSLSYLEPADEEEKSAENTPQNEDDPVQYYKNLTKEAQELSKSEDWQNASQKLNKLSYQWSEGPEVENAEAEEKVKDLYSKFTKAEESFNKQKEEYYAKADKKRKENLSQKRDLIREIEKIVNDENWNATGKVKSLQTKWSSIGAVPKEQAADINQKFESLIKEFKSHKVDRLVEKRQKREDNLMMKMAVLDKMEQVAGGINKDTTNWDEIDETFEDLTTQWKKIGRVPREKSNQVWSRYKAAQDEYYDNKYKYDIDHRSNVDSFTAKKENVIEEAEALVEQDDIAKAARKVNKLHRRWKKIGNLPQRKEDELWDRFKSATDAFNKKKAENQDLIEKQEEQHYQQKLELIEKAEEVKDTNNWDEGHQKMQSLMDRWKKIGPVPRKKSNKIWKQFKGAMDVFYDRRREHFAEAKEQQKENLKKKEEILEKLRDLHQHPDPIEAVDEAKKLQSEFKDVGYVPIKKKNEMWQKYREACDVIYDRMRAAKSGNKFDQELAKADLDAEQRSEIQELRKEHKKIEKEVRDLKDEVLQLEESKANFNFSDDDNPLLKDMEQKIAKLQAQLENKRNKLEAISMEMDDIREDA